MILQLDLVAGLNVVFSPSKATFEKRQTQKIQRRIDCASLLGCNQEPYPRVATDALKKTIEVIDYLHCCGIIQLWVCCGIVLYNR